MNRQLSTFLLISIILIASFFTWQLVLHKKLENTPISCTGDKFLNNTCGIGFACINQNQPESRSLFQIPTTSQDAISIINEFKENDNKTGLCIPWASQFLRIPLQTP